MTSRIAKILPIAMATALLTMSSAWAAGRIYNIQTIESDLPYNGFIVRYKSGTTERLNVAAAKSAVGKTMDKLIRAKSVDASFLANRSRPFTFTHARHLDNEAHLFKPSRKLAKAEALATLRELANDPNVEYVGPNVVLHHFATANDPLYYLQWHMGSSGIHVEPAWDVANGTGVKVAVIDTGITAHPDLDANILPGYDFITDTTTANDGDARDSDASDPGDGCGTGSSSWHGTHVAGIIAALTNNNDGLTGVAFGSKVMPVRALGRCGGDLSDIASAIRWSAGGTVSGVTSLTPGNAATIINMSLGGVSECTPELSDAIADANSRGATVIVAAGNDNMDARQIAPANCAGAVTVAAVDQSGNRASFSNYGPKVDVAAPGVTIWSTFNTGTTSPVAPAYAAYNGTSQATPQVSGVAALIQSRRISAGLPTLTPSQMRVALKASTRPSNCPQGCGTGIIDATLAMSIAKTVSAPVSQQYDGSGKASVMIFERTATAAAGQFTDFAVDVPDDYIVIGGGVQGAGAPNAHLITASYPNAARSAWLVSTKEHLQTSPVAITAWAIGLKVSGLTRAQLLSNMNYRMSSSAYSEYPSMNTVMPAGYTQIGGGFQVVSSGTGNLAWASYPTTVNGSPAWAASAKDHGSVSTASIRTYSIGLRTNLTGVGVVSASTVTSATSGSAAQPSASATTNTGYALTGCGAYVNWTGGTGNLLWNVQPTIGSTTSSCNAQSTEHLYSSPATINTYAVGIRIN